MKVCIVGPTYPYRGGIAHYTTLLTQHLQLGRHEVRLFSYIRQYPRWLFPGKSDRDPSATPLQVPCEYVLDPLDPRTWRRTAQHIAREQPDIVILQWWVPFWAPSLISIARTVKRHTHTKLLFICHNVLPHEGENFVRRQITRAVLAYGDALIVHSEQDQQIAQTLLPKTIVQRTAHPTYQVFEELTNPTEQDTIRPKLGLQNKQLLLFFGFVRPYKGLMYLLDALPFVQKQLPNIHLLIVGEFWGSSDPYLDRLAQTGMHKHVTIIDRYIPNEEVGAYFAAADVVVLPYISATQSGIVQLAFGFGVPVITTRVGGLHEAVQHEKTGLLVPPQDAAALAEAIVHFFQEDRGTLLRATIASEQTAGQFAWTGLVRKIESIID